MWVFDYLEKQQIGFAALAACFVPRPKECSGSFPAHGFRCQLLSLILRQPKALPHSVGHGFAQLASRNLQCWGK